MAWYLIKQQTSLKWRDS